MTIFQKQQKKFSIVKNVQPVESQELRALFMVPWKQTMMLF